MMMREYGSVNSGVMFWYVMWKVERDVQLMRYMTMQCSASMLSYGSRIARMYYVYVMCIDPDKPITQDMAISSINKLLSAIGVDNNKTNNNATNRNNNNNTRQQQQQHHRPHQRQVRTAHAQPQQRVMRTPVMVTRVVCMYALVYVRSCGVEKRVYMQCVLTLRMLPLLLLLLF